MIGSARAAAFSASSAPSFSEMRAATRSTKVRNTVFSNSSLPRSTPDAVAAAIQSWAVSSSVLNSKPYTRLSFCNMRKVMAARIPISGTTVAMPPRPKPAPSAAANFIEPRMVCSAIESRSETGSVNISS